MYNIYGKIIPGKRVGDFIIGCSKKELLSQCLIERDFYYMILGS